MLAKVRKLLTVLLVLGVIAVAALYYCYDRWARENFVTMIKVPGVDFVPGLSHGFLSNDVSWSGNLTGPQQAQLMHLVWRETKGSLTGTEEMELGEYYTPALAQTPYSVTISGMPLGLAKDSLPMLDQRPENRVHIVLHSLRKF